MKVIVNVALHYRLASVDDFFNNLLVGAYRITASASGFATAGLNAVQVELNKTTTANDMLSVRGTATEVNVTDAISLIDTTTAQVTNTYFTQMIADLPLAANPQATGVYNLSLTGAGVASSGGVGVGYGPAVGGQRPRYNNFMVEGTDNNLKDVTGPNVDIPIDAIKEFSVLQNQFSPEFGHSSGGQFNAVVLGGTSETHGLLYEYFQNRELNARDQAATHPDIARSTFFDDSHQAIHDIAAQVLPPAH